jgi:hypothetical protein
MKETIKVEGHPGFVRNADNNVILNINKTEIEIARERKKLRKQKEQEFETLKNEVGEIKELLLKLIEKQ